LRATKLTAIGRKQVLALGVLGFGKNGLDFCVREKATDSNVCVIDRDLLLEVEEMIERRGQSVRAAARVQIQGSGIPSERITHCPLCTISEPELFHSWRRDQVKAVQWSGIVVQAAT